MSPPRRRRAGLSSTGSAEASGRGPGAGPAQPGPIGQLRARAAACLLAGCVGVLAAPAAAQEPLPGTIGLLKLPALFGAEPCQPFTPEALPVFRQPGDETPLARIESRPQGKAEDCQPPQVASRFADGSHGPLPQREAGYEEPAAVVLARQGAWFQVALSRGEGWVQPGPAARFIPLQDLYRDALLYFTAAWDGRFHEAPDGKPRRLEGKELELRLLDSRLHQGHLWLQLEVLAENCEGERQPQAGRRGWVPARDGRGRPAVWFYSRGC